MFLCNETQAVKKSKHFTYFSNFQTEKYKFLQGNEVFTRTHLCILVPALVRFRFLINRIISDR